MHLSLIKNTRRILMILQNVYDIPIFVTLSFSDLNINSIRNRVDDLDKIVDGNIDILYIAETKSVECFPSNQPVYQYKQTIYTGYRSIYTASKGGLVVFIKSHILLRRLNDFKAIQVILYI